jgi:hypothetical protein
MPSQRILDVVPASSDDPGMEFMTRSTVSMHQVRHYSSLAPGSSELNIAKDPILTEKRRRYLASTPRRLPTLTAHSTVQIY